jgi:hypothetical protein
MWLSADLAMGEYIPQTPINDEAKKYNQNLPGLGGVYNYVSLHAYHYAGNNQVKLTDPNGRTTGSFPDGSLEQDAMWNKGHGLPNKYESLNITENEKNILIAAVLAESSPRGHYTTDEIAGITVTILNRALEGHLNKTTVSGVITAPGQVNGIKTLAYRYAMSKLDPNYSLSEADSSNLTATDRMSYDKKLADVTNIANRVLAGSIPDPTRELGDGRGALNWGSRSDFKSDHPLFKSAREGKYEKVLYERSNTFGTHFFRAKN